METIPIPSTNEIHAQGEAVFSFYGLGEDDDDLLIQYTFEAFTDADMIIRNFTKIHEVQSAFIINGRHSLTNLDKVQKFLKDSDYAVYQTDVTAGKVRCSSTIQQYFFFPYNKAEYNGEVMLNGHNTKQWTFTFQSSIAPELIRTNIVNYHYHGNKIYFQNITTSSTNPNDKAVISEQYTFSRFLYLPENVIPASEYAVPLNCPPLPTKKRSISSAKSIMRQMKAQYKQYYKPVADNVIKLL